MLTDLAVVAIGRNEGERLRACLASALRDARLVVYVDSGSSDGSAAMARTLGAEVVDLDLSVPFTAARARNEGWRRALEREPGLRFLQFVDGDCEFVPGWLERAATELAGSTDVAAVCGRRRERHPDASDWNRLCDLEWDTPVGDALACGGDALFRAEALAEVGGYDPAIIAGEEPELCVRLRLKGWKILRIDAEMTLHDAAMTRFGQWIRRAVRAGHAYAEGRALHGGGPARHWVREVRSIFFWGLLVPLLSLGAAWPSRGISLALLAGYPLLGFRVRRAERCRGRAPSDASLVARAVVLAKFPQAWGMIRYWAGRLSGRRSRIIEYKGPVAVTKGAEGSGTTGPGAAP